MNPTKCLLLLAIAATASASTSFVSVLNVHNKLPFDLEIGKRIHYTVILDDGSLATNWTLPQTIPANGVERFPLKFECPPERELRRIFPKYFGWVGYRRKDATVLVFTFEILCYSEQKTLVTFNVDPIVKNYSDQFNFLKNPEFSNTTVYPEPQHPKGPNPSKKVPQEMHVVLYLDAKNEVHAKKADLPPQ